MPEQSNNPIHNSRHSFIKARTPMTTPKLRLQEFESAERQVVHRGVLCSNCFFPIIGVRFTCMNCNSSQASFNLCEECEALHSSHDPLHVFAKFPFETALPVLPSFPIVLTSVSPMTPEPMHGSVGHSVSRPIESAATSALTVTSKPTFTSADITVIPFSPNFMDQIHTLEREAFRYPYPDYYFHQALHYGAPHAIFIAVHDNQLCGYISLKPEHGSFLEIASLAVFRSCQGLGVGRILMDVAPPRARSCHINTLELHVSIFNRKAMSLYYKLGFKPVEWLPNYYVEETEDALRLSLIHI